MNYTKLQQNGNEGIFAIPYDESQMKDSALKGVSQKTDPEPNQSTPDPSGDVDTEGGVITRTNEFRTKIGSIGLETIALDGYEISNSIKQRVDEMYRNQFPNLVPKFEKKCTDCGTEHGEIVEECDSCGSTELRDPSVQQKQKAEEFFESVNNEGQSLRDLYKDLEADHSQLGVGLHIIKKRYTVASETFSLRGNAIVEQGNVYCEGVEELIRADPKRVRPVVDENGRVGGVYYACPIHRKDFDGEKGRCDTCGAEKRDVHFAEVESTRSKESIEKVYFHDEIITWSFYNSRLYGMDGLSPVSNIWMKQAILEWMDLYAGSFYDPHNEQYPGKMAIVHTTNAEAFEKQLDRAKDEAQDNPYAQGILYNEYSNNSQSSPEVQVIDMMSDEILGQSEQIKSDYKNDIRNTFGVSAVHDSDLSEAGGLSNEGLQLEVTDRAMASAHQDMMESPLKKLMDVLGFTDWEVTFVPPKIQDEEVSLVEKGEIVSNLNDAGVPFRVTDGEIELVDTSPEDDTLSTGGEE